MKRRDLIRKIEEGGAVFIRHGGKHDWYQNPLTKMSQPVARHTEGQAEGVTAIILRSGGERPPATVTGGMKVGLLFSVTLC
jgi:hypothetical protein